MKRSEFYSVPEFLKVSKKKLPKFVFDFIDGAAGEECAAKLNVESFKKVKIIPSMRFESESSFNLDTNVLGLNYSAPFGVSPLGLCGLIKPNADIILAKAAAKFNVPYVMSAAASQSIETILASTGVSPWFQLYIPKVYSQLDSLLRKAHFNNCPVLIVTVDTQVPGRRLRDLNNNLRLPYKLNYKNIFEAIKHPCWTMERITAGKLSFPNFEDAINNNPNLTFGELMGLQTGGNLDWDVISKIREKWKNKLVLKGVLSAADAIYAKSIGIDAVILSNHGGRQLDSAPAPMSLLPVFLKNNLNKEFLMLDSGVRSGSDISVGLASGASFVFLGRAFLYALAAGGEAGVDNLFEILFEELMVNLKLIGVSSPKELDVKHCLSN